MIKKLLLCWLSLFFPFFAFSSVISTHSSSIDSAIIQRLSHSNTWKKLLVYEPDSWTESGVESAILTDDFFLAADGRTDPKSELLATINAFSLPVSSDDNLHAQCRFPARYQWLKSELKLTDETVIPVRCPEYLKWTEEGAAESISVVFASGYLGNPASYYGHTLLKLNSKDKTRTRLLDTSINFGAIVNDGDDPLSYILKGLFGGYNGGFSHAEYYFHNQNYGELELRDLWEYELDLTADQVDFVLAHIWEVMGKEYQYFFLNKNCSFRLGELLELIEGVKANPDNNLWVIPQSQILELDRTTLDERSLVKEVSFHPSRQSRLYEGFASLNAQQKEYVTEAIENPPILNSASFHSEPLDDRYSVLDTLLDYYQFVGKAGEEDDELAVKQSYQSVLAHRYRLPPGVKMPVTQELAYPHEGRDPSFIQFGWVHTEGAGSGARLNIRPAYYDSLDAGLEHSEYGELIMGQVQLSAINDKVMFNSVDLVSIKSLSTKVTGLPGDERTAWRLKAGLQSVRFDCTETCLTLQLEGDKGYTTTLGDDVIVSGFIGGAVRDNRQGSGNIEGRVTLNVVTRMTENLNTQFEYQHKKQLDESRSSFNSYRFETRYQLAKNWDLRGSYQYEQQGQYTLLLGHYW
ncbi:DUF4105 domain-containing protein [uncultured Endozoicomonas sp.]|uniref:Lnb N-terminal periplasmic domain-containing protein n=1 Tax=uncultured Endozoicomonas sp. TaxID=432652 RepID=UPI002631814B|nr:DUF4105 domain-containing protein [uncultured Endozoicomonas sp.]